MLFIKTKSVAITKTEPMITGKSKLLRASTISLPSPFQPNIYSTNTAPASIDANQPDKAVTTGFSEFFKACLVMIWYLFSPFAFAVRM
jgi:hypothetical protein